MKCCPVLATNGLCKSSPFVRKSCPKSCNPECSTKAVKTTATTTRKTSTTTLTPATTTTRPDGNNCRDNYSNCSVWAKHNEHCPYAEGCCREGNYVAYMKKHCGKACGYTCWWKVRIILDPNPPETLHNANCRLMYQFGYIFRFRTPWLYPILIALYQGLSKYMSLFQEQEKFNRQKNCVHFMQSPWFFAQN